MELVQNLATLWTCPSVLSGNHLPPPQPCKVIMLSIPVNQ